MWRAMAGHAYAYSECRAVVQSYYTDMCSAQGAPSQVGGFPTDIDRSFRRLR